MTNHVSEVIIPPNQGPEQIDATPPLNGTIPEELAFIHEGTVPTKDEMHSVTFRERLTGFKDKVRQVGHLANDSVLRASIAASRVPGYLINKYGNLNPNSKKAFMLGALATFVVFKVNQFGHSPVSAAELGDLANATPSVPNIRIDDYGFNEALDSLNNHIKGEDIPDPTATPSGTEQGIKVGSNSSAFSGLNDVLGKETPEGADKVLSTDEYFARLGEIDPSKSPDASASAEAASASPTTAEATPRASNPSDQELTDIELHRRGLPIPDSLDDVSNTENATPDTANLTDRQADQLSDTGFTVERDSKTINSSLSDGDTIWSDTNQYIETITGKRHSNGQIDVVKDWVLKTNGISEEQAHYLNVGFRFRMPNPEELKELLGNTDVED